MAPTPKLPSAAAAAEDDIVHLKARFDRFLHEAFVDDQVYKKRNDADFAYLLNGHRKSTEFLSLFIGEGLRRASKNLSEQETDDVLDGAAAIFRFVGAKDVFERFYKQHLAKRFLPERSVSDDAERAMIAKLRAECCTTDSSRRRI